MIEVRKICVEHASRGIDTISSERRRQRQQRTRKKKTEEFFIPAIQSYLGCVVSRVSSLTD